MRDRLPRELRKGRIVGRQTTYWDLASADRTWRVHFRGQRESRFVAPSFATTDVSAHHPLLISYLEPYKRVYVASKTRDGSSLVADLEKVVADLTLGWRSVSDYENRDVAPSAVLESGMGLLVDAPGSVVEVIERVLSAKAICYEVHDGRKSSDAVLALMLGRNFVVADHFEFTMSRAVK